MAGEDKNMLQESVSDSADLVPDPRPLPPPLRGADIPRINSHALLQGGRELVIVHGGEEYRLRRTSQNKLILTK